ncbi:MAG TPA: hypothetical protein VIM94_04515 [Salegentibacter sp.]|uniref:hypothetical protein n=1 Tax=Salegentibacter sp. TaxID=1903072 RepID=UPI002F95618F
MEDPFSDIPEYTPPVIVTEHPNQSIYILKEETFFIRTQEEEISITGDIKFKWFPQLGVQLEGVTDKWNFFGDKGNFDVLTPDKVLLGKAFTIQERYANNRYILKAIFVRDCFTGDITIPVNEVKFSIPNMSRFDGLNIKEGKDKSYSGRIFLKLANQEITIDKLPDFEKRISALKDVGGYHITYSGKISFKTAKSLRDMKKDMEVLNCFIQLLNGSQKSALFFSGISDGETVWTDFRSAGVDPYHERGTSCFPRYFLSQNDLSEMEVVYANLLDFWTKNDHKTMIRSAVNWYSEANTKPWYHSNTSMIISQSALELFYNWYMIEKDSILRGDIRLSAANKIRLLLSRIGVKNEVPEKYKEIVSFLNNPKNKNEEDAIDATVLFRNAIVHGEYEKRAKLSNPSPKFKSEANNLSLWYLELCLLYTLGYKGRYSNRTTAKYVSDHELVPWNDKKPD